ncbi:MAG: hypothetical protein HY327_11035 [Chloroflexi bacterium]|nr:hypothetical protein [Chloroflexota bacterium]
MITLENGNVKIPVEMTEDKGWVVLKLSPDAQLRLRADKMENYPPEKLGEIARAIQGGIEEPPMPAYYHPSKARALRELRELGITNVSGGEEHGLKPMDVPLEKVRQGLASIKGSLSDEILRQREEQL